MISSQCAAVVAVERIQEEIIIMFLVGALAAVELLPLRYTSFSPAYRDIITPRRAAGEAALTAACYESGVFKQRSVETLSEPASLPDFI